jgi:hypothetical protein
VAKVSEDSELTIPLKNLLSLVGATAVGVWAYFGITERLGLLEREQAMMMIEVEENDNWIDNFTPPPEVNASVQRVRELELQLVEIKSRLKFLEAEK